MPKKYKKNENGKVVEVIEVEVDTVKLQQHIDILINDVNSMPELKLIPDEETLEFFNIMNVTVFDKEEKELEIARLEAELAEIELLNTR
jgi:hypothetical protein